jgi:predicted nucleic acid-binding protein
MIVFSNTTPFIALASIQQLYLLPRLFQRVHVVADVAAECRVGGPVFIPDLTGFPWIQVVASTPILHSNRLLELDKGEKHTLDMACKYGADWVLIDEKIGRNVAEYLGLHIVGTLGILLKAKQAGLIDSFSQSVAKMQAHGVFYHPLLIKRLAKVVGE